MAKQHLHERRHITFREYGALLATRELLARGDLEFKPGCEFAKPGEHVFNMSTKGRTSECGSVGCIGGTMALLMGVSISSYVQSTNDLAEGHVFTPEVQYAGAAPSGECSYTLGDLFYPPWNGIGSWDWITPKIAGQAIDNWLKRGKPGWKALKKEFAPEA